MYYSKTCVKRPLSKRLKNGFQDQLSLNAGQKYCRMLQGEHSAILSTFIKLPFVVKIFVLSIFERLLKKTKSATMNIFEKKNLFKSFVKVELSYVFTINLFAMAEDCTEK